MWRRLEAGQAKGHGRADDEAEGGGDAGMEGGAQERVLRVRWHAPLAQGETRPVDLRGTPCHNRDSRSSRNSRNSRIPLPAR